MVKVNYLFKKRLQVLFLGSLAIGLSLLLLIKVFLLYKNARVKLFVLKKSTLAQNPEVVVIATLKSNSAGYSPIPVKIKTIVKPKQHYTYKKSAKIYSTKTPPSLPKPQTRTF